LHPLLEQQLKEAFGPLGVPPAGLERFIALVDGTYAAGAMLGSFDSVNQSTIERRVRELERELERREALEQETRRSQVRFAAFMDNAPMVAALKDPNGILLYANRACERHFPHLPDLLGKTSFAWLPPEIAGTRSDDTDVIAAGRTLESVRVVHMPGRADRYWLVHRFPVPGDHGRSLIGIFALDVTERMRAEDSLRRQALILELIDDAVVITDTKGRISGCNAATKTLFGYEPEELVGQVPHFWKRATKSDVGAAEIFEAVARDGRWTGDIVFAHKDGTEGVCEAVVVPLWDELGDPGFVAVNRDITERLNLRREIQESERFETMGQMVPGIAKEIDQPSQHVSDTVHFLDDAFRDLLALVDRYRTLADGARAVPALEPALADAQRAARAANVEGLASQVPSAIRQSLEGLRNITDIVKSARAFTRPEGRTRIELDLNATLENVLAFTRHEWNRVAEVETAFDPALPRVWCSAGEIDQVFLMLLMNAAHAIAEVVPEDAAERGRIRVTTRHDGGWVEVRVSDSGREIPPDQQARLFDPFASGAGQNLAVTHRVVVENHGGTMTFETESGKGTTYVVRLPIRNEGRATEDQAA
jgi:PAS domain S-box-containing protein